VAVGARRRRPPIPVRDPRTDLPPTAQRVLEAAQSLLREHGYRALTLANIQRESGENSSAVRYYFGDKAGLVEALVEAVFYDGIRLLGGASDVPPLARADTLVDGLREISAKGGIFVVFFELLPHAMRDDRLHDRLVTLYEWYFDMLGEWAKTVDRELGGPGGGAAPGLAALITAVSDGLGLQAMVHPRRLDVRPAYAVFADMLQAYVQARLPAAEPGGSELSTAPGV
jgi:AcrR family transcriptional regulator